MRVLHYKTITVYVKHRDLFSNDNCSDASNWRDSFLLTWQFHGRKATTKKKQLKRLLCLENALHRIWILFFFLKRQITFNSRMIYSNSTLVSPSTPPCIARKYFENIKPFTRSATQKGNQSCSLANKYCTLFNLIGFHGIFAPILRLIENMFYVNSTDLSKRKMHIECAMLCKCLMCVDVSISVNRTPHHCL